MSAESDVDDSHFLPRNQAWCWFCHVSEKSHPPSLKKKHTPNETIVFGWNFPHSIGYWDLLRGCLTQQGGCLLMFPVSAFDPPGNGSDVCFSSTRCGKRRRRRTSWPMAQRSLAGMALLGGHETHLTLKTHGWWVISLNILMIISGKNRHSK